MKTLSAGLQTLAASNGRTLSWAITITRADAEVFRYCSGARNATVGGDLYLAAPGFTVSNITVSLGFVVDTLQMTVLTTDDLTKADFLAGRWNGARVDFNQFDWTTVASGFIPWPSYRVSNVKPILGGFELEMRDLRQLWQQDFTRITGKQCLYRLGDAKCAKSLVSFTHTFTVTGVTSRRVFTCSALAQAADYFSNGVCIFDDGTYAGLELLIQEHATGGVLTLSAPLITDISIGQTGTVIAGCRKRRDEDCVVKFDNVLNFGGDGADAPTAAQMAGDANG